MHINMMTNTFEQIQPVESLFQRPSRERIRW